MVTEVTQRVTLVPVSAEWTQREGVGVRAGEEERYTEYVTAALPSLRRLAYLLCGDGDRADDVVQTAITRLYVHWRKAADADNLDAYARKIVLRTFLNERRKAWTERVRLIGSPSETPGPPAPAGPDTDTRAVLLAALRRVPPRQRAVLVLRFLLDYSVADTAAHLGCSEGNVRSLTSRGTTALRAQLGAQTLADLGKEARA